MKKKKRWKIVIMIITLLAIILGSWCGRKEELKAEELQVTHTITTRSLENPAPPTISGNWTYLPEYKKNGSTPSFENGGWLNSITSYIPKEYVFTMQYLPGKTAVGTEVGVDYSSGVDIVRNEQYSGLGLAYLKTEGTGTPPASQWVKIRNVGYYDGRFVTVKLTVSFDESGRDEKYRSYVDLRDTVNFLSVTFDHWSRGIQTSYEFFYEDNEEPINDLQLYWTQNTNRDLYVVYPLGLMDNIFSISDSYKIPSGLITRNLLFFDLNALENHFSLSSDPTVSILDSREEGAIRIQSTTTLSTGSNNNKIDIQYKSLASKDERNGMQGANYLRDSMAKMAYPSPMKYELEYSEIIAQDEGIISNLSAALSYKRKFDYGFLQKVPWETLNSTLGVDNRTQNPTWHVTPTIGVKSLEKGNWQFLPKDLPENTDFINLFNVKQIDNEKFSITADNLKEDSFYNHYYLFNSPLNINYEKLISKVDLDDKYCTKISGSVKLEIKDDKATPEQHDMYPPSGMEADYSTTINFYAPLEYKYINSVTGEEIPAGSLPESAKPTGNGVVTWDAPLTPMSFDEYGANGQIPTEKTSAPTIAGYTFKTATFNGDSVSSESLAQVKVTKLLKDGGDATKAEDYTQNNVVTLEYQPLYTVDVQVGALDTDGNFGTIPFAPPSGTNDPYVTAQETTAPTTPENAISPTGTEPAAEFTFPTTYDFEVGTGKSYKVTQMENVNNDYTKPNQATSPVFLINDQNQLVVDGQVVSNSTYQGEDFILSWDATNKKLTIQIINQPNGEYQLVSVAPLDYGKVSLPQKNPDELIKRQDADWKVQFTDTRLEAYRTPLKLSVRLDQNFTNTNDPTKTISGILLYRSEATTPITPDAFLIEGEEIPIKEKINPNSGPNDIDWTEQAGFLLQIDAEKQTKIFAGDYQAELTFILSEDPL